MLSTCYLGGCVTRYEEIFLCLVMLCQQSSSVENENCKKIEKSHTYYSTAVTSGTRMCVYR